jgi:ribulose-phosphate 3-epimerase
MSKTIVSPSVLSADFGNMRRDIEMLNDSEAEWVHLDIMDGVFVNNISFGFPVIENISKVSTKKLDVHLMIVQPEKWIQQLADLGTYMMNVHYEACPHLHGVIQNIKKAGMKAGVTLNPHTPVSVLEEIIADVDLVLLMSVNPGFSGQSFIENTIAKTARLKELIKKNNSSALIQVDGGVNYETGRRLVDAGADSLVSGNFIFKSDNPAEVIKGLGNL